MATGYLHATYEQAGASNYAPSTGNENAAATAYSGKAMYFPIMSAKPTLGPNPLERDDELRNYDQPIARITDTYDPTWDYESRAYPDLTGWHLANLLGRTTNYTAAVGPTATNLDGTTALAAGQYSHTWVAPFGPSGAIPQSSRFVFAYADQSVFYEVRGAATEQLEITTPDQGGAQVKASGPATFLNTIANPSLTPAYETPGIRPFVHGNLSVTYADTSSGYTTANAGTASEFAVTIRNPVNAIRTLGVSSQYPDRLEKDDTLVMISGTLSKRNLTQADWDAMRNLQTFTLTASWVSTTYLDGASGAKYGLQIKIPNAQLVSGDIDNLDNKRRHGSQFQWQAIYDGTTASATIKLVNKTATYAV